jgi:hypothetical protein
VWHAGREGLQGRTESARAFQHIQPVQVKSLRIGDFGRGDIEALYAQHGAEGGAAFAPDAIDAAHELTGGQPWLVNALAAELVDAIGIAAPETIGAGHVQAAAERLIRARATHIDSLGARLDEPRVRGVLEPLVAGADFIPGLNLEDLDMVRSLGLIALESPLRVANPIVRDVVVRLLGGRP